MKFRLDIDCDNAAFSDGENNAGREVARILALASLQISSEYGEAGQSFPLFDSNGNRVGEARFEEA